MTDCIGALYAENKIELLWSIEWGAIYDENNTRQQCDWLYRYGLYVANETKLSWLVRLGAIHDENHIGQQCDQSYRCGL